MLTAIVMTDDDLTLTPVVAWAAWNASRIPGMEIRFEQFMARARRASPRTFEVPLEDGMFARIMQTAEGPQIAVVDGQEVVKQPIAKHRLEDWMKRIGVRSVGQVRAG